MFINDTLCNVIGYSREELIGSIWFERFVPPDDLARRRQLFASVKRGAMNSLNEGPLLAKTGELKLIAWDNTSLRGLTGEMVGIAGMGRDVTAEREAERPKMSSLAH